MSSPSYTWYGWCEQCNNVLALSVVLLQPTQVGQQTHISAPTICDDDNMMLVMRTVLALAMVTTVASVTKVCSVQVVLDTLLWSHYRDITVNSNNVTDQGEIDRLTKCVWQQYNVAKCFIFLF